jgi:Zn-dependent metalloprotease
MYSLTVNFKTVEELQDYLKGKVEHSEVKQVMPGVPPVIEEKKPAKKPAKKAAPVEVKEEPEFEEVESPFQEVELVIDRDKAIATAQKLVGQLKATGIADDKLMPAIHEVYAQAGCPVNLKISQLDDSQLSKFIPLFELKVNSIVSATKVAQTSASFI